MATAPSEHAFTVTNSFTKGVYRDVYPAVDPRQPILSQKGKIVLITGASRGIGRHGIAEAFALAGARAIIITARKVSTLSETASNIKRTNPSVEVLPLKLEVTDESSVAAAFATIATHFPDGVDILINNAGSFQSFLQPLSSAHTTKWWTDFEVNVKGAMLVTKYFLSQANHSSSETGAGQRPKQKHIIYLSSAAGLLVHEGSSAYSITKLADVQLAAYAAAENRDQSLHVVAVHPGIVRTDMMIDAFAPFAKDTPELAGAVINWATTDQAQFLNGRFITVNWDVNELVARKQEIVDKNLLTVALNGIDGQTAELLG